MSKYENASNYYRAALQCWKKFKAQHDASYNYTKFISLCGAIAELDLPDPFAGKADEEPQEELKDDSESNDSADEVPFAEEPEDEVAEYKATVSDYAVAVDENNVVEPAQKEAEITAKPEFPTKKKFGFIRR